MVTYVALLRGVNVGKGKRVPMAKLRELLDALGYTEVATLLNSGNAVFRAEERPPAKLAADISAAIRDGLGIEVPVVVKSSAELGKIVAETPVQVPEDENPRLLVIFAQEAETLAGVAAIEPLVAPEERFALGKRAGYLYCAKGISNSEAAAMLIGKAGKGVTTRNLATVRKLLAMARERDG
jgi:uncharacterized protein (DUF1697 family)